MEKSKKYNIHAAICPDCNGNGYVKAVLEEGREHVVLQWKEKYMWMSPRLWSLISMLIILQIMLASCTRDIKFDGFDPTTTVVRWVFTGDKK
jgi:hypothetical protein